MFPLDPPEKLLLLLLWGLSQFRAYFSNGFLMIVFSLFYVSSQLICCVGINTQIYSLGQNVEPFALIPLVKNKCLYKQ